MIIDMRCRVPTLSTAQYFHTIMKNIGRLDYVPALKSGSLDTFLKDLEDSGITSAVSVSGNNPGARIGKRDQPARTTSNDEIAALQHEHLGKIIGVAGIDVGNTFHNSLEELERCSDLGLKAAFIEPGRSPGCLLNDRVLYPIYQKCVDLDMAIIPQTSGLLGGKNFDYANPKYIEDVAEDFPDLRIICGHGCYPFVREMIMVCQRRDNVWASPDVYLLNGLGTMDWVEAVNRNMYGFADQFIFGSAYPFMSLKDAVNGYLQLPWNEDVLPKIFYKNALKALKLDSDPVFQSIYPSI